MIKRKYITLYPSKKPQSVTDTISKNNKIAIAFLLNLHFFKIENKQSVKSTIPINPVSHKKINKKLSYIKPPLMTRPPYPLTSVNNFPGPVKYVCGDEINSLRR